jgi:hypothetical protein
MIASKVSINRCVGRPKANFYAEHIGALRAQGVSWRKIGKALKIGTATAMRQLKSISGPSLRNSVERAKTPERIESGSGLDHSGLE